MSVVTDFVEIQTNQLVQLRRMLWGQLLFSAGFASLCFWAAYHTVFVKNGNPLLTLALIVGALITTWLAHISAKGIIECYKLCTPEGKLQQRASLNKQFIENFTKDK